MPTRKSKKKSKPSSKRVANDAGDDSVEVLPAVDNSAEEQRQDGRSALRSRSRMQRTLTEIEHKEPQDDGREEDDLEVGSARADDEVQTQEVDEDMLMQAVAREAEKAAEKANERVLGTMQSMMDKQNEQMTKMMEYMQTHVQLQMAARDNPDAQSSDDEADKDSDQKDHSEENNRNEVRVISMDDETQQSKLLYAMVKKLTKDNFDEWEASLARASYKFGWDSNILSPKASYKFSFSVL